MTTEPASAEPRVVGIFLFPGWEPLDVFGPLEMFGGLPRHFRVVLLGPEAGPVASAHGAQVVADAAWEDAPPLAVVMVPGGQGTRTEVTNPRLLGALRRHAESAELVTSVCTGAALLAAAGLLDGRRATSNKRAFEWVRAQGASVEWVAEARWVVDGNVVTSGGVAAGMDMALYLIERLHGREVAQGVATRVEYDWHTDAAWDPFAAANGLVEPRTAEA